MFQLNAMVSHFMVLEEIGDGGMGVVYRARDTEQDRIVALKCFKPFFDIDDTGRQRFFLEAEATSSIDHPHICSIHTMNETPDGQMFMVMPYYSGGNLKDRMGQGRLALDEIVKVARQMALGLLFAHERQIIHRDIKPGNIMFDGDGTLKIVDFGIAKLLDHPPLTNPGTVLGTMAYMPPEQAEGEPVNHQADIWSFGVVLYELLSGKLPFEGKTEQQIYEAILMETPVPCFRLNDAVPKPLSDIVDRALAKSLEERYQSFADVIADLDAYQQGGAAKDREEPKNAKNTRGWFSALKGRKRD